MLRSTCPLGGCRRASGSSRAETAEAACPVAEPCSKAEPSTCTERALSAWSSLHDARDTRCIYRMFDDACTLGDMTACGFAGRMALGDDRADAATSHGIEMLSAACYSGISLDCIAAKRWVDSHPHESNTTFDEELGARLELERACLGGMARACDDLGRWFDGSGKAAHADGERAADLYARGCNLGLASACNDLGDILTYGRGVAIDRSRAVRLYERTCLLGDALGCGNVAYMLERGLGVAIDRTRARALYRDSCKSGETYSCLHVGMFDAESRDPSSDLHNALERWTEACAKRDARACAFVGVVWEDGPDGQNRDEEKSLLAFKKACDLRDEMACQWIRDHDAGGDADGD